MRSRRQSHLRPFGWLSALIFNSLIFGCALLLIMIILETRQDSSSEFEPTSDALLATQQEMGKMFADLVPNGANQRSFWAGMVDREIRADDLTSARGFLLAAPQMLNRQDAAAVTAATTTDTTGSLDERLLAAAKLFLPDDVRARYERAVSPQPRSFTRTVTPTDETEDSSGLEEEVDTPEAIETAPDFFVLGDARDLAYLSAGWVQGDRTDVFSLSISGLGLIAREGLLEDLELDERFYQGASLLKSAIRANRLDPDFENLLRFHLERAMPEDELRENLEAAFAGNSNLLIQTDVIFEAYADAVDTDRLRPFLIDLERIAELADGRTNSAALMLLETVSGQRDLKRAELISYAGGDRAIALAKHYGPDALDAAASIIDWSMHLIMLIAVLAGGIFVLGWLAFSTFLRSFTFGKTRTGLGGFMP
ncbi:hypothetical protein [Ponticaulis sp.]|uniref:hypothetical protein n=1 Tax=Ponticaulis sp. TaxID=2020902 RepID=UPI000B6AA2E4|nr:hypothetical protein [Ponticaulis sp.]MAI90544.1 hypothetical protein [Ponticaulis sp.]OUY00235.1 MAG: hypothetical protein CBB65_08905 [Hyphomonadaceae bacterium TMED5]|tara:strand:- start:171196 stop:172467 length:1272 start_codon:yes stop_codon:yes gene_type:complete